MRLQPHTRTAHRRRGKSAWPMLMRRRGSCAGGRATRRQTPPDNSEREKCDCVLGAVWRLAGATAVIGIHASPGTHDTGCLLPWRMRHTCSPARAVHLHACAATQMQCSDPRCLADRSNHVMLTHHGQFHWRYVQGGTQNDPRPAHAHVMMSTPSPTREGTAPQRTNHESSRRTCVSEGCAE